MTDNNDKEQKSLDELIKGSAEIAGNLAGVGIGLLLTGVSGLIIGTASVPLLTRAFGHIGLEIQNRLLSKREQVRVGATLAFAAKKINEKLLAGEVIRQDDFFKEDPVNRSAAEEITEGVLLSAQRDYEEKKIPFHSNLLANIAFHPEIDRAQANLLVRLAERLSYRQLCLLFLFAHKNNPMNLKSGDYRQSGGIKGTQKIALLQEVYDLYNQAMLHCGDSALIDISDIDPSRMGTHGMGGWLYQLMELKSINMDDINSIVNLLKN